MSTRTTSLGSVSMWPRNTSPVRAVDRHLVALVSTGSWPATRIVPRPVVDLQRLAAGDAHLAHLARHQRGVAGHAAARGEDALRGGHAADVLRRRLDAHQDHRFAARRRRLGVLGVEEDAPGGGARAGVESLGQAARFAARRAPCRPA